MTMTDLDRLRDAIDTGSAQYYHDDLKRGLLDAIDTAMLYEQGECRADDLESEVKDYVNTVADIKDELEEAEGIAECTALNDRERIESYQEHLINIGGFLK